MFDDQAQLVERGPTELLAQAASRPVLVQVQGNLTTPDTAIGGLLWTHTWLDLNGALNGRDKILLWYPLLFTGDRHPALGRVGLLQRDVKRLGAMAAVYDEHNIQDLLGREHTLLNAVTHPQIARWIAPYAWAP